MFLDRTTTYVSQVSSKMSVNNEMEEKSLLYVKASRRILQTQWLYQ